jgi:hypothetical protein
MPEDKVIKSGQFTLGRLAFLAACGIALFIVVAKGLLLVGYLLLTLVLCVLLFVIAIDYGVDLDKVDFTAAQAPAAPSPLPGSVEPTASVVKRETKTKRPASRSGKRRR